MPTAVSTKNSMNGIKRKGAPSKDAHAKETKKPKIDSGLKSAMKSKKAKPVKKSEEPSGSDSDGGVPLDSKKSADSEDLDESDTTEFADDDDKPSPVAKDGIHPERAKAVLVNSKSPLNTELS
jgi:pumilio family protein 6